MRAEYGAHKSMRTALSQASESERGSIEAAQLNTGRRLLREDVVGIRRQRQE
jgi:hypothetical protein